MTHEFLEYKHVCLTTLTLTGKIPSGSSSPNCLKNNSDYYRLSITFTHSTSNPFVISPLFNISLLKKDSVLPNLQSHQNYTLAFRIIKKTLTS